MNVHAKDDESPSPETTQAKSAIQGMLLSGGALKRALNEPDYIFREGSWEFDNVRGPGYDLRLAGDRLVYPVAPGKPGYRVVDGSGPDVAEFTLAPGDAALISTIERFSLDFSVAATVGDKWLFAARGLLKLSGNAVHPGYGRRFDEADRCWCPKEDERLSFVVANVGPDNIVLRQGDRIAYLQFYTVESVEQSAYMATEGFEQLRDRLFRYDGDKDVTAQQVWYFRSVRGYREELDKAENAWQIRWNSIEQRTNEHDVAISRITDVTSLIIVFGVFLISATLLGFVLTTLTELIQKMPGNISASRNILITVLAAAYGLCCTIGVSVVTAAVWSIVRRRPLEKRG